MRTRHPWEEMSSEVLYECNWGTTSQLGNTGLNMGSNISMGVGGNRLGLGRNSLNLEALAMGSKIKRR